MVEASPEVGENLEDCDFKKFPAEDCILLIKKEYEYLKKVFGLRLLHRHIKVQFWQILAEIYETFKGKKPTKLEQHQGINVFEYSCDRNVKDAYSKLTAKWGHYHKSNQSSLQICFENLLGIVVFNRSWHSNYPSDQKFLEHTYDDPPYPASLFRRQFSRGRRDSN